jgi:hypothetical protein
LAALNKVGVPSKALALALNSHAREPHRLFDLRRVGLLAGTHQRFGAPAEAVPTSRTATMTVVMRVMAKFAKNRRPVRSTIAHQVVLREYCLYRSRARLTPPRAHV